LKPRRSVRESGRRRARPTTASSAKVRHSLISRRCDELIGASGLISLPPCASQGLAGDARRRRRRRRVTSSLRPFPAAADACVAFASMHRPRPCPRHDLPCPEAPPRRAWPSRPRRRRPGSPRRRGQTTQRRAHAPAWPRSTVDRWTNARCPGPQAWAVDRPAPTRHVADRAGQPR